VRAEGDLDFRGTLAVAKDAPIGFTAVRVTFGIRADSGHTGGMGTRRIMYVELISGFDDDGPAWIAYVDRSKTGRTLTFHGRRLQRIKDDDAAANHVDPDTGEAFWVSSVKRGRHDRRRASGRDIEIDADAADEYAKILDRG